MVFDYLTLVVFFIFSAFFVALRENFLFPLAKTLRSPKGYSSKPFTTRVMPSFMKGSATLSKNSNFIPDNHYSSPLLACSTVY